MPEEVKATAPPTDAKAAKTAAVDSPRKRSSSVGKAALANILLLDGTIMDVHVDVS